MDAMNEIEEPLEETEEHDSDEREMSFLDHLEELRWRLVKSLLGLLACVVLCSFFADRIVNDVVLRPSKSVTPPLNLINTVPFGQITFYMMVIIVAGLILSSPWILYQVWKFVEPGLKENEKKYISGIVVATTFCFLAGIAFAYFLMLPYMLQFFATFGSPNIQNMIAVTEYMSFVIQLVLLSGLIFELPMVAYFLARLGIMTPAFMRHYRRHAIVAILIIAAIVTPTTDPVTMAVFALPMFILYEISIWIASIAARKREEIRAQG
jgi:sec-independent protein translocase protein TatC